MKNIFKIILSALVVACACQALQAFTLKITNTAPKTIFYACEEKNPYFAPLKKNQSVIMSFQGTPNIHIHTAVPFLDKYSLAFTVNPSKESSIALKIDKNGRLLPDNWFAKYTITGGKEEENAYWFYTDACSKLDVNKKITRAEDLPYVILKLQSWNTAQYNTIGKINEHYNQLQKTWRAKLTAAKTDDERRICTRVIATIDLARDILLNK